MRFLSRLLHWPWVVITLVGVILAASGFRAIEAGTLTVADVAVGVATLMLVAFWRTTTTHQKSVEKSMGRIDTALFGPEDGDGERPEGGLVRDMAQVKRLTAQIPVLQEQVSHVAVEAATAADAARQAQRIAADAIKGRDPKARTRSEDRDDA